MIEIADKDISKIDKRFFMGGILMKGLPQMDTMLNLPIR